MRLVLSPACHCSHTRTKEDKKSYCHIIGFVVFLDRRESERERARESEKKRERARESEGEIQRERERERVISLFQSN